MNKQFVLVRMSTTHAQWLGMAASVAGGCVAVSQGGVDAVSELWPYTDQYIGMVPSSWLPSSYYQPLTSEEGNRVRRILARRFSGWSGAENVNKDYAAAATMLHLEKGGREP